MPVLGDVEAMFETIFKLPVIIPPVLALMELLARMNAALAVLRAYESLLAPPVLAALKAALACINAALAVLRA